MDDLNSTKTRDELTNELNIAQASYDGTKVAELEAAIKALDEKGDEHKIEMTEATQKVEVEEKMKMEDLIRKLQDKPENAVENAREIIDQAKVRLQQTIQRYIEKIKETKNTNTEEVNKLKEELKKEKDTYEKVKKDFFAKSTYTFENFTKEDLGKIPTNMVRYATREGKLFNSPGLTKMKTLRRNKTIKTLIKKFNAIGTESKNWVRFIMGFEKSRFLRYTGIKVHNIIDKAGSAISMQMNPQDFHTKFNAWRNAIFAILDANTGDQMTEGEKTVIQSIKNRINYYGATYARERANARVSPFLDAEKNATEKGKIIQMTPPNDLAKTG